MTAPAKIDLSPGVHQLQTPLWQTNSLLVEGDGGSVAFDPGVFSKEVRFLRGLAEGMRRPVQALAITHSDFDHVCGVPYFPEAVVICGADSAAAITSGVASEGLRDGNRDWGADWPVDLRVGAVIGHGDNFEMAGVAIQAIGAPSHGRDGLAYLLPDHKVLMTGDHSSAITYPALHGPFARLREATVRLIEAIRTHQPRWIVPGHGPALAPDEAMAICVADLAYLDSLMEAADHAVGQELPPMAALLHVYGVPLPRPTTLDFEIYEDRVGNARRLLEQRRLTGTAA